MRRPFGARGAPRRSARRAHDARPLPARLITHLRTEHTTSEHTTRMIEDLVEKAEAAAAGAYAPYSNYLVGAVVRARDGREFVGVNVENAAYPLGMCAEKTAIAAAAAAGCRPGD
ncbi:MAG TPA: hypothetical protein VG265_05470, partial [Gaiellaceae bacterium]|nr:hypothetical protein [Gaiellaceae bacterium]